jgi:hypothetical protein
MNKHWYIYLIVFLALCWFLIAGINQFPYPASGNYSDYTISHYPNLIYTKNSIATWHQIPLWSSMIMSGYPFMADPLSSLWYPPYWIAIALPAPWGLNILTILHLVAGALGMMYLLQEKGISEISAFAGAVVFLLMPKLIAHLGAGHITLVWAVTLTPWLLVFEESSKKSSNLFKKYFFPGLLSGLVILADVRWAAFCWVFWWCYGLFTKNEEGNFSSWKVSFYKKLVTKIMQSLIGLLFASPLLLPLFQFIQLSTRRLMNSADTLTLSLPPGNLFGLIFPNLGGSAEWFTYFGALPILLMITGCTSKPVWRKNRFWVIIFFTSILVSLGSYLPGMQALASIPGFDLLRVPSRALFLAGISLSVITANEMEELQHLGDLKGNKVKRLILVGFILLVLLLTINFSASSDSGQPGFIWGGIVFVLMGSILLLATYKKIPKYSQYILVAFLLADLSFVSFHEIRFEKQENVFAESSEVASIIEEEILPNSRIYSPSYSISQETAMNAGLQLADGVNPMQLENYVKYMAVATGIYWDDYSVTLPAFISGTPESDNKDAVPDAEMLGILNVQMIVSAFPINADGLILLEKTSNTYIYNNTHYRPRVWIQKGSVIEVDDAFEEAIITQYSPTRIQIDATGPGVLVLADPNYPGWVARVDGRKTPIQEINELLRGVSLPEGQHTVAFSFQPILLYIGLILLGCILMVAIIFAFFFRKRNDP